MKFTKCVIGADYKPVGFVYVDNGIERYEDFASLCRRNASDGDLYFSDSGVFGLYKNSENAIDICRETVGGGYSDPIDPKLTLTERIISGGNVVGFVVKDSTGTSTKKHIASILSAAKYMLPDNFTVVERDGRQFLRGKGTRLTELPAIDITPGMKTPARPKTVRTEPYDVVDPRHGTGASIAFIAKQVEKYDGVFLKLPEDKYKPVGESIVADGEFSRLTSVCEVAYPAVDAAMNKLSASLQFKVPGTVLSGTTPVLAYIYRKKNIVNIHHSDGVIRGDKVRLGRVVIAIPRQHEQEFYSAIAGTIAVESMVGTQAAVSTAMKLVKMQDPVFLSVDLTNISLLGYDFEKYLMAGAQIKATVEAVAKAKYAVNFAKRYKEALDANQPIGAGGGRNIWDVYTRYDAQTLRNLEEMGVDITNGTYTDKERKSYSNKDAISKTQDIEVEYEVSLKLPSVPRDAQKVYNMKASDLAPEAVGLQLEDLLSADMDDAAKRKHADKLITKYTGIRKDYERKLFYHKVAMLLDGNNTVHSHDKDEWASTSVRANAQFIKYTHTSGVAVKLRQIEMGK